MGSVPSTHPRPVGKWTRSIAAPKNTGPFANTVTGTIRRAGDLLQQFQNERARTDLDDGTVTQKQAGRDAGMSERQEAFRRCVSP